MSRIATSLEPQIHEVREALAKLRSMKKFRGKKVLIRDTEQHLARLLHAQEERECGQDYTAVGAV